MMASFFKHNLIYRRQFHKKLQVLINESFFLNNHFKIKIIDSIYYYITSLIILCFSSPNNMVSEGIRGSSSIYLSISLGTKSLYTSIKNSND